MKIIRKAHLWIGLICSIFILMESITGLVMNEPWLIGQTQIEGKGDFPSRQMNFNQQGSAADIAEQTETQTNGQSQTDTNGQSNSNDQIQEQNGTNGGRQFPREGGPFGQYGTRGEEGGNGSLMSIIKGLHEGRIGTTNIKWLIDLIAIAMIFLTGTGIYLSIQVLLADKKRKKRKMEMGEA